MGANATKAGFGVCDYAARTLEHRDATNPFRNGARRSWPISLHGIGGRCQQHGSFAGVGRGYDGCRGLERQSDQGMQAVRIENGRFAEPQRLAGQLQAPLATPQSWANDQVAGAFECRRARGRVVRVHDHYLRTAGEHRRAVSGPRDQGDKPCAHAQRGFSRHERRSAHVVVTPDYHNVTQSLLVGVAIPRRQRRQSRIA